MLKLIEDPRKRNILILIICVLAFINSASYYLLIERDLEKALMTGFFHFPVTSIIIGGIIANYNNSLKGLSFYGKVYRLSIIVLFIINLIWLAGSLLLWFQLIIQ